MNPTGGKVLTLSLLTPAISISENMLSFHYLWPFEFSARNLSLGPIYMLQAKTSESLSRLLEANHRGIPAQEQPKIPPSKNHSGRALRDSRKP